MCSRGGRSVLGGGGSEDVCCPAHRMGLVDGGLIREGMIADTAQVLLSASDRSGNTGK